MDKVFDSIFGNTKTTTIMVIFRGLPGSGRSTAVNYLKAYCITRSWSCMIFGREKQDLGFYEKSDSARKRKALENAAHSNRLERVRCALQDREGESSVIGQTSQRRLVVINRPHTQRKDYADFESLAKKIGVRL